MGRIPRGRTYVQHLELSDNYQTKSRMGFWGSSEFPTLGDRKEAKDT